CPNDFATVGQSIGKFDGEFTVFWRAARKDFEREHGGARQLHGGGGLDHDAMGESVLRGGCQDLFRNLKRFGRIFAERDLSLGNERLRASRAPHFFEETPSPARLLELSAAQRFATVVIGRFAQ